MNTEFKSRQVYPNGNSSAFVIEFSLPREAMVTLSVLSEHGKNFEHVIEKVKFGPGTYEVEIERDKCTGGVCFYRLVMQTDGHEIVDTKRILMGTARE